MSQERRLDRLDQQIAPPEPPMTFRMCQAPRHLTPAEHAAWHHERNEYCFTLDLGAASIREGDAN
jgi:hypothetical protein